MKPDEFMRMIQESIEEAVSEAKKGMSEQIEKCCKEEKPQPQRELKTFFVGLDDGRSFKIFAESYFINDDKSVVFHTKNGGHIAAYFEEVGFIVEKGFIKQSEKDESEE